MTLLGIVVLYCLGCSCSAMLVLHCVWHMARHCSVAVCQACVAVLVTSQQQALTVLDKNTPMNSKFLVQNRYVHAAVMPHCRPGHSIAAESTTPDKVKSFVLDHARLCSSGMQTFQAACLVCVAYVLSMGKAILLISKSLSTVALVKLLQSAQLDEQCDTLRLSTLCCRLWQQD